MELSLTLCQLSILRILVPKHKQLQQFNIHFFLKDKKKKKTQWLSNLIMDQDPLFLFSSFFSSHVMREKDTKESFGRPYTQKQIWSCLSLSNVIEKVRG